ncbi:metalloregulator ArsR/SmtB family transcription factor [Acidiphilium sp. AL]|uniref:ArsR/SmtB family transcription factor n=1 Tax=Acidiphilium sp. AL TaxID=2871704 RepID=UPI0021CB50EF|nr:metalloregulator ArsR/SmtB family transcription factor [Acidiphilium sp. AL]MCU4159014.1 metalloregulator ArsR/SmtB family transcription factor [Acidiphilium sp. AL]
MINLDTTFAALADPTRRAILSRLALGETTVGELAEPFSISLPAISRHLRVLEAASLITRERSGQHRRCRLNADALREARDWLEHYRRFWTEAFDRLDEHLKQTEGDDHGRNR